MSFIDTHLHLDSDAFGEERDEVVQRSREAGVTRWINVGYNEARWASSLGLVARYEGMACMLGLHPGEADDWSDALGHRLRDRLATTGAVAVGEIGIDLYWRQDNLDLQRQAFREQLAIALDAGLPAVIHMRSADTELLAVLEAATTLPHVHFHSFDGGAALREWVLGNEATIGAGGLLTRRGSEDLQAWIADVPRDRVVLETDAPYLKPRGIRGKRNEPAFVVRTAKLLAQLWETEVETVSKVTTENAERIFGLEREAG